MKQLTAIVTDVRYRMSLAVIRDLAQAGVRVVAVEFNKQTPPLGFYSKYVDKTVFMDADRYLDQLYDLCLAEATEDGIKPALIPVSTATMNLLVAEDVRARFASVAGLCLALPEHLALLNDKEALHQFAQELGVPVPTEYAGPYNEASYPCVVKPLCGEKYGMKASERYRIAGGPKQLAEAVSFFKDKCGGEEPVVQQYIAGAGFGCSVFAKDGKILSSIMHRRIREYPISGGPSACCETVDIPLLLEYSSKIVKQLNYTGLCMFEFKQGGDGHYYLLESNPRVWGSYPLTRCAKSDMTLKWFQASINNGNPSPEYTAPDVAPQKVRMHFLTSDLASGLSYLKAGRAGLWLDSLADVIRPGTKGGLFEWGDMKPAIKYLRSKL